MLFNLMHHRLRRSKEAKYIIFAAMQIKFTITCLLLMHVGLSLTGQRNLADSTKAVHLSINYAYQNPAGDLAQRFGANSAVGFAFHVKEKSNFYWGVEASVLFGNRVYEPGLMSNLYTRNGEILDNLGAQSSVEVGERGYTMTANIGKVFPVWGSNVNSGILVKLGLGHMMHKIRLEHSQNDITQLEGEYLKGYDRYTSGLMFSEFVGYYHMGDRRVANFYAGFEFMQGLTQGRRPQYFDTMAAGDVRRTDLLLGIRVGWVIHLYSRMSQEFYLY